MCPDDGGIDNQVFEVWIIGHRLKHPPPDALLAPTVEASKDAVPRAKNFGKIAPRRARPHDPENRFDKHPVIAPGRATLVRTTNNKARNTFPLFIAQYQTVHNGQGFLLKESLESRRS